MEHSVEQLKADLKKWQMPALIAGVVGLALTAFGYTTVGTDKTFFWEMYLMAFLPVAALTLGSLGILIISHLATGRWFHYVQRVLEAGAKNIFYLAILFVGVWAGRSMLYHEWINRHDGDKPQCQVAIGIGTEHVHPIAQFNALKTAYMTEKFWTVRGIGVLALYAVLMLALTSWSKKQAATGGGEPWGVKARRLSGPGIIIFALATTILAYDLLVALDAQWVSSIYGAITFVSFGLTTLAFLGMFMCKVRDYEPYQKLMMNRHSHDIGTMMFAFTVLWTYMQAGQLIIIWNGNMIEETSFYFRRIDGAWPVYDWILFIGAFIIPFLLLLNQPLKKNKKTLAMIGAWVFLFRYLDWFWEITPWFHKTPTVHWIMIAAPVGMLGIWFFLFLRNFIANPLPVKTDARVRTFIYDHLEELQGGGHH